MNIKRIKSQYKIHLIIKHTKIKYKINKIMTNKNRNKKNKYQKYLLLN